MADYPKTVDEILGRRPTAAEEEYVYNMATYRNYGVEATARGLKSLYGKLDNEIRKAGKVVGIDLSDDQVADIRQTAIGPNLESISNWTTAESANVDNFIRIASESFLPQVASIKQDTTITDLEDKLDKVVNPEEPEITQQMRDDVSRVIQEEFKRDATADEIDFFAKEMANGQSLYELRQFLKTTPEYIKLETDKQNELFKKESADARRDTTEQLLKDEDEAFKRALPEIMASYQRSGILGSSGVENAIAKARAEMARQRESLVASSMMDDAVRREGYSREALVGSQSQAFQNYLRQSEPGYQNRFNIQNLQNQLAYGIPLSNVDRAYGYAQDQIGRNREISDYYRQQSDYDRYLNMSRDQGREAALYGLFGQLAGAGIQGAAMYYGQKR